MGRRALRVGIDVGGTFTDLAAIESWSGNLIVEKVASTPREPHRAVIAALANLISPLRFAAGNRVSRPCDDDRDQCAARADRTRASARRARYDRRASATSSRSAVRTAAKSIISSSSARNPLVARDDRLTVRERIDYRGEVARAARATPRSRASAQRWHAETLRQ